MKILIIRFSSFGDVLLTTPVIRKIKEKYPDSEIDFIVYESFSEAVSLNPYIRKLILFNRKKSRDRKYINEVIGNLKKEKYDFVVDLHSKLLSRVIGKSLSDSRTEYLRYKKRKWWKTLLVKAKLIAYNADCTIVESYFTALKKINLNFDRSNIDSGKGDALEFYIDKVKEEEIVKKYDLKNTDYFVLAPGASKFTKKWPFYDELSKKILQNTDSKIFVIGVGDLSQSILALLHKMNNCRLTMTNRSLRKSIELQKIYPDVETTEFSMKYNVIRESDIIISATSAPHLVLLKDKMKDILNDGKKRFFLDLAVPRDIETSIGENENASLYHLEDIWDEYNKNVEKA